MDRTAEIRAAIQSTNGIPEEAYILWEWENNGWGSFYRSLRGVFERPEEATERLASFGEICQKGPASWKAGNEPYGGEVALVKGRLKVALFAAGGQ